MGKKTKAKSPGHKVLVQNRKARFNYEILEKFEAGLVLEGWEIKSLRAGKGNLNEAYVRPIGGELFLLGAHFSPYTHTTDREVDPTRERKLLLHKKEIAKLSARVREKGLTIAPLRIYLKHNRAKLEIGLGRGKAHEDKRDTIKEREAKRDMERAFKESKK